MKKERFPNMDTSVFEQQMRDLGIFVTTPEMENEDKNICQKHFIEYEDCGCKKEVD